MAHPEDPTRGGKGGPIRFGIMCNGLVFATWQAECIRALMEVPGVEAALLIVRDSAPVSRGRKLLRLKGRNLVWALFNKGYVERRSRASSPVDLSASLAGVQQIYCRPVPSGRYGEEFGEDDLTVIREYGLDFVLRFGFGILRGPILDVPRYGVWSFHHGDERRFRGRPPCFWELVEGEAVVGSMLQRLTERLDGGVVLHRGFFRASAHSYLLTRDNAFLGSAEWPSLVCRALLEGNISVVQGDPSLTNARVRREPTNRAAIRFLWRQAAASFRSQWRGLTSAQRWTVGVADVPITSFLSNTTPEIRWLPEVGKSRYLADPFAIEHDGGVVALVEDYDYREHRGVISALRLEEADPRPRTVLDLGVHASYPFLLKANGSIWCVPETYQAREVRLYRASHFPDVWELAARLVTGVAALDPTIVFHNNLWWLFCTDHEAGPNTKLLVWYASELLGPWLPHMLNPVKTDVRSSRPAGTPFSVNGVLYRPAQDASHAYGGAIVINRVDVLAPSAFSESPVSRVTPPIQGPYRDGLHTLSAAGEMTIVDGNRNTFVAASFRREFRSRLVKLTGRTAKAQHGSAK